jgi:recombinational DNA repair ATPase RecF
VFPRELHVENFRAIRRASLRLNPSTTLIGENDSGTSSLLESVLGGRAPGVEPIWVIEDPEAS